MPRITTLQTPSLISKAAQHPEDCCDYASRRHYWFSRRRTAQWLAIIGAVLLTVAAMARVSYAAASTPAPPVKPYRVLIVAEHRSDPGALIVNMSDKFQPIAALLKAWSIPFDILTLDQQHLDSTYLFRRSGGIRYGAVIWVADAQSYKAQDLASLVEAAHAGTSLVVIDSRALDPTLDSLLGIRFMQFYTSTDPFRITGNQYIVRGIESSAKNLRTQGINSSGDLWVQPTTAKVLVSQGEHPVLTVNRIGPEVSGIWLEPSSTAKLASSTFWRKLFFRSLVGTLGYLVVPNADYANRIIFEIDDWGTADKTFLSYWRYVEPDEATIQQDLIAPLEKHHAIAEATVDTGFVDRRSQRIESPWTQTFTDRFGQHQDYTSTQKGLKEALAAGVLNIESHGWTHMDPDLESPPGPWWTANLAGEASVGGWYDEFRDQRRDKGVAAAAQLFHMERSLAELQNDFGVQALELKPGGGGWTKSRLKNTAALATRVGFGLFSGDDFTFYLDHRLALDMSNVIQDHGMYNIVLQKGYNFWNDFHAAQWPAHPDGPVILGFHDKDIALDHDFLNQLFAALPATYRTLGSNQYIGILHTRISSSFDKTGWNLSFFQDSHYCDYFANHSSSWRLWLSDPVRQWLASSQLELSVDGRSPRPLGASASRATSIVIELPAGTGTHTWRLESASRGQER